MLAEEFSIGALDTPSTSVTSVPFTVKDAFLPNVVASTGGWDERSVCSAFCSGERHPPIPITPRIIKPIDSRLIMVMVVVSGMAGVVLNSQDV